MTSMVHPFTHCMFDHGLLDVFYRSCVSWHSRVSYISCVSCLTDHVFHGILVCLTYHVFHALQIMCFMAFSMCLTDHVFHGFLDGPLSFTHSTCVLQIMRFMAFSMCLTDHVFHGILVCLTYHVFHALQIMCFMAFSCVLHIMCFMPYRSCVSSPSRVLQIMCFMAFSMVSLVTAIVSIQLLRLGLVNQATDGSVYQKEHKDRLILIALPFAGVECLFCIASSFASCRLAKAAKALLAKKTVGTFYIQVVGPKEILLIEKHKHKNKQKISLL